MEQEEESSSGEDSKDDDTMVRSEDESSAGSSKTQSGQLDGNFCRPTSTMVKCKIFSNFDPDMSMEISVDLPVLW